MSTDDETLIDFVLWRMRRADLPSDVQEAAWRLNEGRPGRPNGLPSIIRYTEGPLIVDGMSSKEEDGVDRRKAHVHQVGAVVRDLLERRCSYILIQDLEQPGDHLLEFGDLGP